MENPLHVKDNGVLNISGNANDKSLLKNAIYELIPLGETNWKPNAIPYEWMKNYQNAPIELGLWVIPQNVSGEFTLKITLSDMENNTSVYKHKIIVDPADLSLSQRR